MSAFSNSPAAGARWRTRPNSLLAGICLVLGVAFGMFAAGGSRGASPTRVAAGNAPPPMVSRAEVARVTPDRLKHMADKQAEPLLAQLKSTPDDPQLLARLGYIYYTTGNFQEAAGYFKKSVDIKDDVIVRTELGRAYYYAGDPSKALAQFEHVLKSDPDHVNARFNQGIVRWQSLADVDGAVAAWQRILEKNPNHPRRAEVEQLIASARQHHAVRRRQN